MFLNKNIIVNAEEYYQEIYDFITKNLGERFPKRLLEEVDKKIKKIFKKIKRKYFQQKKLHPFKTQKFKSIKKF